MTHEEKFAQEEAAIARIQRMRSCARGEQQFDFQDPAMLTELLFSLQERLPGNLHRGGWSSPTSGDSVIATNEILDLSKLAHRAAEVHGLV